MDIGCGSGLFSLAAKQLGAKTVKSFDYDKFSVEASHKLKKTHYSDDETWHIEAGNVLDENYIKSLGQFDVVYSWGVLHHTGDMENALINFIASIILDDMVSC